MPKKRRGKPKLANCSSNDVTKAIKKIGGFTTEEGSNHTKITHIETQKASTIPRCNPVDRNFLKDFVEEFLRDTLGYTENLIYTYLWC